MQKGGDGTAEHRRSTTGAGAPDIADSSAVDLGCNLSPVGDRLSIHRRIDGSPPDGSSTTGLRISRGPGSVTGRNLGRDASFGQDDWSRCRPAHRLDASPDCERGASCPNRHAPTTNHPDSANAGGAAKVSLPTLRWTQSHYELCPSCHDTLLGPARAPTFEREQLPRTRP
jgi:hypothetical protein